MLHLLLLLSLAVNCWVICMSLPQAPALMYYCY